MPLKAKPPDPVEKRLKMFMYGPAGVGKTTAAIQFPRAYIIDAEKGADNYDTIIRQVNSVILKTNDMDEVISEVKALLTEAHDFRTLVIDPITPLYDSLLEKCEKKVGTEFGRHYGEANKVMKRFINLVTALDMNVVVTAHQKKEYGQNLAVLGNTFDGWKKLDYLFDLVIELDRNKGSGARVGRVKKTRIEKFPDGEAFDWSYAEILKRGGDIIERQAKAIKLASPEQIAELRALLDLVKLPEGTVEKWLTKAGVEVIEDMPSDAVGKCVAFVKSKLPAVAA